MSFSLNQRKSFHEGRSRGKGKQADYSKGYLAGVKAAQQSVRAARARKKALDKDGGAK